MKYLNPLIQMYNKYNMLYIAILLTIKFINKLSYTFYMAITESPIPNPQSPKPVIIISGPPGSGTTTVARALAKHFGMEFFSTGDIFRHVAKERGLAVGQLSAQAEQEVDWEVDNKCKQAGQKGNVVIESDAAAWYVDNAIKIWLDAPLMVRAERVFNDMKQRVAEKYANLMDVAKEIKKRRDADRDRYQTLYGFSVDDTSIYDLKIDTEFLSEEEVIKNAIDFIAKRLKSSPGRE